MNICIVSNLFPPEIVGGAERHAEDDAKRLSDRGHDVSVITTQSKANGSYFSFNSESTNGVDVHRFVPLNMYSPIDHQETAFWKKPIQHFVDLWNPHTYWMVKLKLDQLNPDVVHIHNYSGLSASVFAAANNLDLPVVHTLHDYGGIHIYPNMFVGGEIREPRGAMRLYSKFNRRYIEPNVVEIVAPSQFIINKHHEYGLYTDTKCTHLPLGKEFDKDNIKIACKKPEKNRLLYVGQLTYMKGVDILIRSVKQIHDDHLRLDILGKGPEKENLVQLAKGDPRIKIHGFVSEQELEEMYHSAHFTVVPSRWYDNSPMVIYESYAHGTPVIGADIGGIPELVSHEETGLIFPAEDISVLTEAISRAFKMDYSTLQANILNKVGTLNTETHINGLEKVYQRCSS